MGSRIAFLAPRRQTTVHFFLSVVGLWLHLSSARVFAQDGRSYHSRRFEVWIDEDLTRSELSPELARMHALLSEELVKGTAEIASLYGLTPDRPIRVGLVSLESYHRMSGAPEWSSGIYHGGQILIPWTSNLRRSPHRIRNILRHELVHAVVARASRFRCPAWLDEGLAQIFEGHVSAKSKRSFLQLASESQRPHGLQDLREGFTTFNQRHAEIAYAQSYLAVRELTLRFGTQRIGEYVRRLASKDASAAFSQVFGMSLADFEGALHETAYRTPSFELPLTLVADSGF